jgi:predicted metalloprotease with PDZ domain
VCIALDLEIMNASKAKHSLDDIMRYMFSKYPLDVKGYTNQDFRRACEKFSGKSLKQFFADYVYGTKPVEWEKYLDYAGLTLLRSDEVIKPVAGLFCNKNGEKIVVRDVLEGSSSARAGILPGDEIIAMDGVKLSYDEAERKVTALKKGDKIKLTVFRGDKLVEHIISMEELNITKYSLKPVESPSKLQQKIYAKWLG